ncbi:MAG: hypothetical protein AAF806_31175, partial [Bacteroidota bacterium]
ISNPYASVYPKNPALLSECSAGFWAFLRLRVLAVFRLLSWADLLLLGGLEIALPTLIFRDLVLGFFRGRWLFTAAVGFCWGLSLSAIRTK